MNLREMNLPPYGVYPGSAPRQCKSEAEKRFYEQLKRQLPEGCYAWHRIDVITDRGEQREADFVIGQQGRGILVVEVKGGQIQEKDGIWYQNERRMDEAPLDQARSEAALIERRFRESRKTCPPYECLVVFPDSKLRSAPSNDYLRQRTIDASDLHELRERLRTCFKELPHFERGASDDSWIGFIHERLWGPICQGLLSGVAQADQARREQFDAEQLRIIAELERNRRVIIEGPAGSGKTVIAVEAARRIADREKHVFYLCFTESLAAWLRKELESSTVQVYPIKRLAEKFLQEAGKLFPQEIPTKLGTDEAKRFYESICTRALNQAGDQILRAKAAAVIIDEAQDFQPDDWELAKFLAGDDGNIWAFADPHQKFVATARMEDTGFYYRSLYKQYRSHPSIFALAEALAGRDADLGLIREGWDSGRIRLITCADRDQLEETIGSEIHRLTDHGFQRRQVAILSLARSTSAARIVARKKLGTYALAKADGPADRGVTADTALRFKGLERSAIIVTDLSLRGTETKLEEWRARLHIAVTRAQSVVRIIDTRESLSLDPVLGRLLTW
jgi:hypothetical protein